MLPEAQTVPQGRRGAPALAELTSDWRRQTAAGARTPGVRPGQEDASRNSPVRLHCLPQAAPRCVSLTCRTPLLRAPGAHTVISPRSARTRGAPRWAVPRRAASRSCCPVENTAALSARVPRALEGGRWLTDRAESHGAGWRSERTPLVTPQPSCLSRV